MSNTQLQSASINMERKLSLRNFTYHTFVLSRLPWDARNKHGGTRIIAAQFHVSELFKNKRWRYTHSQHCVNYTATSIHIQVYSLLQMMLLLIYWKRGCINALPTGVRMELGTNTWRFTGIKDDSSEMNHTSHWSVKARENLHWLLSMASGT